MPNDLPRYRGFLDYIPKVTHGWLKKYINIQICLLLALTSLPIPPCCTKPLISLWEIAVSWYLISKVCAACFSCRPIVWHNHHRYHRKPFRALSILFCIPCCCYPIYIQLCPPSSYRFDYYKQATNRLSELPLCTIKAVLPCIAGPVDFYDSIHSTFQSP